MGVCRGSEPGVETGEAAALRCMNFMVSRREDMVFGVLDGGGIVAVVGVCWRWERGKQVFFWSGLLVWVSLRGCRESRVLKIRRRDQTKI